jgi:hypothetical protein
MAEESQEADRSTEQVLEDRTTTMRSSQERFDSLACGLATKRLARAGHSTTLTVEEKATLGGSRDHQE